MSNFTQAQLDALEEAIASGALEVQYKDKKVTYRSISEMLKVRDMIRQSLGKIASGIDRVYPITSKGLDCDE